MNTLIDLAGYLSIAFAVWGVLCFLGGVWFQDSRNQWQIRSLRLELMNLQGAFILFKKSIETILKKENDRG